MAKKKQKLTVACVQLNSKQSVLNNLFNVLVIKFIDSLYILYSDKLRYLHDNKS